MKYLIVLATATLSATKVSLQSLLAKKGSPTARDRVFFTMLIFFAAALLFSPYLFSATAEVWLYAAAYAVCNAVFQIAYICALSRGNVSVAVMFANFGMLLPIAISCLAYGDRPSPLRWIGIGLIALVFILNVKKGRDRKRGYFALVLISMLANGAGLCVQKLFSAQGNGGRIFEFVSASYLLGAILCAVICALMQRGETENPLPMNRRTVLISAGAGAALSLFLALNTYGASVIEGSFQYPAHSGGAILLSTLSGVFLFKDKLSWRQWAACVLGCIAIVIMNF